MSGFGMAYIKGAGCAMHPDETDSEVTDEWYIRQGAAYIRDSGDDETCFANDALKPQIMAALAEMRGAK